MRRFLITLNGIIAAFFLTAFGYTLIGEAHLTAVARDFAAKKTADYAEPIVALAEQGSKSFEIRLLLSKAKEEAIDKEFAEYHRDPAEYISTIIERKPSVDLALPENALISKLHGWKIQIHQYYQKVLGRILSDLRIFSGTNLVAGLISLVLALKSSGLPSSTLLKLSSLLCMAFACSIYGYFNTFSFYQYLFNWHMGWRYPAVVSLLYLYLVAKLYKHRNDPSGAP
ncbi:hypothetical protein [Haloferula sp.]|uniref:hypothetical protein n=1 Tax=Haloferula sp. TaxID=2497595 RepID=UPI003C7742CA